MQVSQTFRSCLNKERQGRSMVDLEGEITGWWLDLERA